jgi:hypothetical protein
MYKSSRECRQTILFLIINILKIIVMPVDWLRGRILLAEVVQIYIHEIRLRKFYAKEHFWENLQTSIWATDFTVDWY